MPLFARRRLQSMLDEIAPHLDDGKIRDLLKRLEDKRVDQVLPAEIELALLWALSRIGDIDIEPDWWGDERRPDAYSEALVAGEPAVIEIAAPNDNAISGEAAMDAIALRIGDFVGGLRRGLGEYLYYRFEQESGYEDGVYFRRRLAPLDYALTDETKGYLRSWIESGAVGTKRLRIIEPGLDVEVEKTAHRQTRFHNTWSSMPPETHSVDDNPLYKLLTRKLSQLRAAKEGTRRFIFLGDAGSTLLRRIGQAGEIDPTRRYVSGREILSHFVTVNAHAIDAVVTIAPNRRRNSFGRDNLYWSASVFSRPGFDFDLGSLNRLVANLPPPRFEGYQARSLFRQGAFSPMAWGWYLSPHIRTNMKGGPVEVKISARSLMDLLAGRIAPEVFRREVGGSALDKNLFEFWLNKGLSLSDATFESGGLDEDDDYLVFTLADDAGARRLNLSDGMDSASGEESAPARR